MVPFSVTGVHKVNKRTAPKVEQSLPGSCGRFLQLGGRAIVVNMLKPMRVGYLARKVRKLVEGPIHGAFEQHPDFVEVRQAG